jgi:hypothetical protein
MRRYQVRKSKDAYILIDRWGAGVDDQRRTVIVITVRGQKEAFLRSEGHPRKASGRPGRRPTQAPAPAPEAGSRLRSEARPW